ncbi:HET-domain-containing protein, partial [Dendrothele bispora CBS 962.96]
RLISTRSLKPVDFGDNIPIPDYAILSHTWGSGEVTFQELDQHRVNVNALIVAKPGYRKILYACREARRRNLGYLWVDTCCINQEDKGDVHRNIRSMYAFYQNSSICYAYLSDRDSYNLSESSITTSRWFSRGWTIQELLAPPEVVFFDRSWRPLGTRSGRTAEISDITGIPEAILEGQSCIHQVGVEERMSWAVTRTTSRPQDQAYCLIGILGVSLEPNYEEDVNSAFFRL